MNILSSYKFQVKSHIKSIVILFAIITALDIIDIAASIFASVSGSVEIDISGQEMALFVFIFVIGISIFPENFHMLVQNGISRKSMYIGRLATVLTVSAICAAVNLAISKLYELVFALLGNSSFSSESFSAMLYNDYFAGADFLTGMFTDVLLTFSLCVALTSVGYFIATLMYRLPKYGKFLFWGALWAVLMIVMPALEYLFFDGAIWNALFNFVLFAMGISSGNPFVMTASCGIVFAVFSAATWFILCKLPVKK